jgi:hypothetical protein
VKKYLLDANIFIQSHRSHYPFDVCPGYWDALLLHHDKKRLFSIDRIKKEIEDGDDRLKQWVNESVPKSFFKKTADKAVIDLFREMVQWVYDESQFTPPAKSEFARVADGWVVAYAKSNGLVVATHEVLNAEIKKKVPIPNVCQAFAVEYVNTVELLRQLGVRLVLGRQS